MYVDESGDPGLINSPTRYFVLSGVVVHELKWREFLDRIIVFRKRMRNSYGLKARDEIHAAEWLRKREPVYLSKNDRYAIIRHFAAEIASFDFISVTNIVVDKQGKPAGFDTFDAAWRTLFQRFSNTLDHRNFPGAANPQDMGIVFCDDTNGNQLNRIIRRMSVYNPVPNRGGVGYRNLPMRNLLEDANMRNSADNYLIQVADLCAYLLYQNLDPSSYIKRKGGKNLFNRLIPILNTKASISRTDGVVFI